MVVSSSSLQENKLWTLMEKELLKYKTGATVVKITYMKKTDIITMEANGGYIYSQY